MNDYGLIWYNHGLQQKPICALREVKRGKNKGMLHVTLCRGRDVNGSIIKGSKIFIPMDWLIEFPPEVE